LRIYSNVNFFILNSYVFQFVLTHIKIAIQMAFPSIYKGLICQADVLDDTSDVFAKTAGDRSLDRLQLFDLLLLLNISIGVNVLGDIDIFDGKGLKLKITFGD
jgi:hypothetical protein